MYCNIRAEMARAGLNHRTLAVKLGVTENTVKNWLTGRTRIPVDELVAMARMFGCTTDYLLGLKDK